MRRPLIAGVTLALALGTGTTSAEDEAPPLRAPGAFEAAGTILVERWEHDTVVLPDGRVLVVGGQKDGGLARDVDVWDPASRALSRVGVLAKGRYHPGFAILGDGRALIIGGDSDRGLIGTVELWDPATGEVTNAGKLKESRFRTDGVELPDGQVVVAGGAGERYLQTIEAWDPDTNHWKKVGKLPEPRALHTTTVLPDGRVLLIGGLTENRNGRITGALVDALVFDPTSGSVAEAGTMHKERSHHSATLLSDGRVLVVGGDDWDRTLSSAEIWDPATNAFTKTGSMAQPRDGHTATALPDGRVLVAGGIGDDDTPYITSEVWDPATGEFTLAGPLIQGRSRHSAGLLSDGLVLIAGGGDDGPLAASVVESYDPTVMYAPAPAASLALGTCPQDDPLTSTLRERFPDSLDGTAVEVAACRGRDWLAMQDATDLERAATVERAEALLESAGATIDDLTIATALHQPAPGQTATITGLRVVGAQASRLVEPAIPLLLGIERPHQRSRLAGAGKIEVLEIRDETLPGSEPTTIYAPLGDTLWLVDAHERTRLADIVEALPGPGGWFDVPELGIAVTFPEDRQVHVGPEPTEEAYGMGAGAIRWRIASSDDCNLELHQPTNLPLEEVVSAVVGGDQVARKVGPLDGGMYGYVGPYKSYDTKYGMGLYAVASGDAVAVLTCLDRKVRKDEWGSIAESIELIPVGVGQWGPLFESSKPAWWYEEEVWAVGEEPAAGSPSEESAARQPAAATPEPTPEPTPQ